jgi:hypothetical protein
LQVYGSTLLRGSGTTSATTGLSVQNSASGPLLQVRDDSVIIIGGANTGMYCSTDLGQTITQGAGGLYLGYFAAGDLGYANIPSVTLGRPNNRLLNGTSAVQIMASVVGNYSPTSGTGTFIALDINNIINQTGGANGITRGIYVNPTLTAAADWRSINWTNNSGWGLYGAGTADNYLAGKLLINTTTVGTFNLDVNGTARVSGAMTLSSATPSITLGGDLTISNTPYPSRSISIDILNSNLSLFPFFTL